ncbi:MAG TPA: type II CAAX endopeptidase family protein [Propionibacteriaceae bacterium]|nr:type II CAAX endopeptidase family protein [Propionibacteriaceae bacterium]
MTIEPAPVRPVAWRWFAGVEVALAIVAVALDLFLPTLVILVLAALSMLARRENSDSLGLVRPSRTWWPVRVFGYSVAWTLVTIGLTIPIVEHLSGERQDVGQFAPVEGNLRLLAVLLLLTWTLAAVGEEVAYRGFLLTRATEMVGGTGVATIGASLLAAAAFGWAHTEQGAVGVVVTFVDALFFTWLRFRFRSLWAAVLAHGFTNTIGLVAYFFVGPIYGLW